MTHLSQNNLRLTKKNSKPAPRNNAFTQNQFLPHEKFQTGIPNASLPSSISIYPISRNKCISNNFSRNLPKNKKKPSRCRMQLQDYAILGMALVLAIEL